MRVGIIGYGNRGQYALKQIKKFDENCELVAIADIRNKEIQKEMKEKGMYWEHANKELLSETEVREQQANIYKISYFDDADEMLDSCELDGVCVTTRCSLHTDMAIKVIKRNIPLYLEKPVSTTMEDFKRLYSASRKYPEMNERTLVCFPLRVTPAVCLVREIISSGRIGTVEHVQAYNNVPYGGCYYHSWYRDENETGGLFLQKATHDFDYINYILGIKPVSICAMTSKQIFKGEKPAGLKCKDCDERETCAESPMNLKQYAGEEPTGPYCSFAADTGNEDSGSALIRYETGMHVAYSQNFFARKGAGKRGARFLGYKGTVEFDWYTDEIKVYMHHTPRVENYKLDTIKLTHGGGDDVLARSFVNIMRGKETSVADLESGLLSAYICLKAKESDSTGTFQKISWPFEENRTIPSTNTGEFIF